MINKTIKPDYILDAYEQEIEDSLSDAPSTPSKSFAAQEKKLRQAAKETLRELKTRPITIRIRTKDLEKIKAHANDIAIPYQTLLGSLFHQFAEGKIRVNWK